MLLDARHVVGMNTGVERAGQPGLSRPVQFFELIAEEFAKLLATIDRLAIRRGAIDHRRQRFDELPEEALPLAQRFLRSHKIVDVDVGAIPPDDAAAFVTQRFGAALRPAV